MALSRPQVEALALLEVEPRPTSKTTAHGYISGAVMKALEGHGWAELVVAKFPPEGEPLPQRKFAITEAGRRALYHHRNNPHPNRKRRRR